MREQCSQKSPQQFGCHHCRIAVALNLTGTPTPPSPSPSPSCHSPLHHLPHHHLPSPSLSPVPTSPCHVMVTLTLTLTSPSPSPDGLSSRHPHFTLLHPCFTLTQPSSLCTKPKWERRLLTLLSCHVTSPRLTTVALPSCKRERTLTITLIRLLSLLPLLQFVSFTVVSFSFPSYAALIYSSVCSHTIGCIL